MSVTSVLDRLDELVVQAEIADLSKLANGLLEKAPKGEIASGHRRYPHLVPMYRTVHRTVPRPMVFRAIRWVNPKRMFPGAGLTKEEMQKMSSEELQELAVKLNTYREEAHVIHNRYNQMIWLIERGQSPYFIPFANIKEPRWLLLEGYMARAERLKNGTMEWEHTLDQQAQDLRSVLLQEDKGKVKFDDIEGLWIDPNGNQRAPMFMDIKQKKGVPLRVQRTINGERLKVQPQAFARLFIGVSPDEVRVGEEVRMPHKGQYVNPAWIGNREKRMLARDMGDAAMFLGRVPKVPIRIAPAQRQEFAERGQLLSIPAGRDKNPVFIVFDDVPAGEVANRRWQRVTQPERGGRHAPGAPLSGPGGVHRHRPRKRPGGAARAAGIRAAEARVRAARQQAAGTPIPAGAASFVRQEAIEVNEAFNKAAANLFAANGIDTKELDSMKSIKEADIKKIASLGGGINSAATFVMTLHNNDKFIFKIVGNEQKAEVFANVIDNILDLNTQAPTVMAPGMDAISNEFIIAQGINENNFRRAREAGGGHLQKFCEPNCKMWKQFSPARKQELVANDTFRHEYHRNVLLDFIGGNWDRHHANFMVTDDGHFVGIDNGFHLDVAKPNQRNFRRSDIENRGTLFSTARDGINEWGRDPMKGLFSDGISRASSAAQIREELDATFDRYFNLDKINDVQREFGILNNRMEGRDLKEIKAAFMAAASKLW